jgi:hypothetical protein
MKKSILMICMILSGAANAGKVTILDSKNKMLAANVEIGTFNQVQTGDEIAIIGSKGQGTCILKLNNQTEINTLVTAIIAGADIICSDAVDISPNAKTFLAAKYSVTKFFGN